VHDEQNIVLFNLATIISQTKEVRIWSMRLHEFYIGHMVLSFLIDTKPQMTIILTGNLPRGTSMFVLFDFRFFIWCVGKDVDREVSCSDCPRVQWLETMISSSSWYCNCDIKSVYKFLLIVKNLLFLDIKECNVLYVVAATIE
jgi:hypothetical protein